MLPIWNTSSVLWSYWTTVWDIVVSTLASHEGDRPDTLTIPDNNRLFHWAENTASRIYSSMDLYSGIYTYWNLPTAWPSGNFRLHCECFAFVGSPSHYPTLDSHYLLVHPPFPQPFNRQESFTAEV